MMALMMVMCGELRDMNISHRYLLEAFNSSTPAEHLPTPVQAASASSSSPFPMLFLHFVVKTTQHLPLPEYAYTQNACNPIQ
jgi:hypothetical protein